MFQTVLITFREGLESLLIIAIAAMLLRRTGRAELVAALRVGTGAALVLSALLGVILAQVGALSPALEGSMALVAAITVMACTLHMMRMGRQMKGEIDQQLQVATRHEGRRAWWAVAVFALFMVGREGVETATIVASLAKNAEMRGLAAGGVLGFALAGAVAYAWLKQGHRVNLSRFFQVTAVFMVLFAFQLVLLAVHEFSEAALLPLVDNQAWHDATEPFASGWIGQVMSMGLVVLPVVWLIGARWFDASQRPQGPSSLRTSATAGAVTVPATQI
jgi:high-affinity iron transporter